MPRKLICIEKDKMFVKKLKYNFKNEKKFYIVNGDILKINLKN